ncbi:MAG: hypothetical protein IPH44_06135 [Myxococcales bacterium]|nr:hypothetical protein [Myxococcales bacterium]MBK7194537.1 hypothetical protein [Myxococcales bacterium]
MAITAAPVVLPAQSLPGLPMPPTSSPSITVPTIDVAAPATASSAAARSLRDLEREGIIAALNATGGNKAQAAAILEIDRSTLYKKLKEYGIG